MASTLAGNLTVLGSVANLIVIQKARRYASISFWEYFKVGLPLTVGDYRHRRIIVTIGMRIHDHEFLNPGSGGTTICSIEF